MHFYFYKGAVDLLIISNKASTVYKLFIIS